MKRELTFIDALNIINILEDKKHIDNILLEEEQVGSMEYRKLTTEIATIRSLQEKLRTYM